MAATEDLEAALLNAWTPENLAVYGDHLMSLGDPRGELISVDLHADEHGVDRDVAHRRRRALRTWLELPVDHPLDGAWAQIQFRRGFVEDVDIEHLPRVLATPAGTFVRSVELDNKIPVIKTALDLLAEQPRPWLLRVSIQPRYQHEGRVWTTQTPLLDNFPRLAAAAPNLQRVDIRGHRLIGAFTHPKLRELRVHGYDVIRALIDATATLPSVTKLSLGLAFSNEIQPTTLDPARLPSLAGLPSLRELDLGRNEATNMHSVVHAASFDMLAGCAPIAELERVRVPQVRTAIEAARLQKALDRMPALHELRVLRARAVGTSLDHPSARIEIEPVAWPPLTSSAAMGWVDLGLPGKSAKHSLWLPSLVHFMPRTDELSPRARAAWAQFWSIVEPLPDGETESITVATMLDALDTMKLHYRAHYQELAIRNVLRHAIATDLITITRRRR